jgi:hypothetical protein
MLIATLICKSDPDCYSDFQPFAFVVGVLIVICAYAYFAWRIRRRR